MEKIREILVEYDEAVITAPAVAGTVAAESAPAEKKNKRFGCALAIVLALVVLLGAGYAGVVYGVPALRYHNASRMLAGGEYDAAREIFLKLGDYKDASAQAGEAGKGLLYLDAAALLEQGKREEAQLLLEKIGSFRDAEQLLLGISNEQIYEQAARDMEKGLYLAAREGFEKLGGYSDAAERAEECRVLHEAKVSQKTYDRACTLLAEGDPVSAYREFASMPDKTYKDTEEKVGEILALIEELAEQYSERGERGIVLACVRLAEEIDAERGAALREKVLPAEACEPDQSFYFFDTTHVSSIYYGTTKEDLASVVIYMLLHGKMDMALMSNAELDYDVFVDRALQGIDLAGEMLPGYGATYNPLVYVGDRYVKYNLTSQQEYSEFERTQNIKRFKSFCEDSVRTLTEMGLLSETMSRQQRAEVIFNWVCFYLTYDQSLVIHDVGIAVRDKKGVCEAFAALFNRMCNLAGIPTYGQIGMAGGRHIWSFHEDEEGRIFYSDSTWGDSYAIDFSTGGEEPTIELFLEYYLERCMKKALAEWNGHPGTEVRGEDIYFWSETLWRTHEGERSTDEIMAFHAKLTGKSK